MTPSLTQTPHPAPPHTQHTRLQKRKALSTSYLACLATWAREGSAPGNHSARAARVNVGDTGGSAKGDPPSQRPSPAADQDTEGGPA